MQDNNNQKACGTDRHSHASAVLDPSERSAPAPPMPCHLDISLAHLDRMTDATGMIQHAIYGVPRRESGYTIDDNARALRLCTRLWSRQPSVRMLSRVSKYLSLLEYARRPVGGFYNLLSYQRHWLDTDGDGDCQGQAVLALCEVLGSKLPDDYRSLAAELIERILPTLAELRSIRAQAYVVLAWGHMGTEAVRNVQALEGVAWSAAQRLVECYQRSQRADWQWFESRMTYANAVLPHALFVAAQAWPKSNFREVAVASFDFLDHETTARNLYWPVGNNGWYSHGEEKAPYDQQPVEAATMVDAALAAFRLLGDSKYLATFHRARDWFHGANSRGQSLVNVASGACYDGLQMHGVNRNQGAESTLAYLLSEVLTTELQSTRIETCLAAPEVK